MDAALHAALDGYAARWPDELPTVALFRELLGDGEDPFRRERLAGHFTASCWLVDRSGTRVLLTHHRKLGLWLQLGGHADGERELPQAALREAEEEVGLDRGVPEILGRLPALLTGTGYMVTPVVALLRPPFALHHDPGEVEEPFEYPIAHLLDPAAPERRRQEFRGRMREFWVWPHERHYIWGATASMLVTLSAVLRGEA